MKDKIRNFLLLYEISIKTMHKVVKISIIIKLSINQCVLKKMCGPYKLSTIKSIYMHVWKWKYHLKFDSYIYRKQTWVYKHKFSWKSSISHNYLPFMHMFKKIFNEYIQGMVTYPTPLDGRLFKNMNWKYFNIVWKLYLLKNNELI